MHLTLKPATRWLLPPAGAVLVALLGSCGGGDPEKDKAAADIEKLQADADEALEKARKAGLEKVAPDEFSKAKKQLEDAAAAVEAGDAKKAASRWKSGTKAIEKLLEEQGQLSEDKAKVASTEKAAAAEAKKKADAAKAPANAAAMYTEAADYQKKADDLLAKAKSKREIAEARQGFSRAKDLFEQSGRSAAENEIDRKRYEDEKKAVEQVKAAAQKRGAEEKAATEWLSAGQVERDAQAAFDRGDFRAAVEQLKQTAGAYQNALSRVATDAEIAEMVAKGEAESEAWRKKSEEDDKQRRADEAAERERKAKELADKAAAKRKTQAAKDGKKGGGVGAIVPFDEFNPELYPQSLDDEDLAFLNENYAKLTKSGIIEYDPTNGFVRLNYIVGKDVEKDIEQIRLPKKEYLTFEDPLLKGVKAKDRQAAEEMSAYSLSGNTEGLVALPVPYRYFVRVEYDMFIQTMNASSAYGTVLMFNPTKLTGYAQDWAKLGTLSGGNFKLVKQSPKKEYNGPADIWHIKYRGFPYMLEYKWIPGAEGKKATGLFQFDYDVGQSDHVLNQLPGTAYTRGQVAFRWSGSKWTIRNLMITGILDKEAAVAKLRKITGIKKAGGGAAEKTEKKDTKKKATETASKPDSKKGTSGGGNGAEKGGTEKAPSEKSGTEKEKPAEGAKKPGDFDF